MPYDRLSYMKFQVVLYAVSGLATFPFIGTRQNSGTKLKSDNEVTETRDRSSKNAGGVRWGIAGM